MKLRDEWLVMSNVYHFSDHMLANRAADVMAGYTAKTGVVSYVDGYTVIYNVLERSLILQVKGITIKKGEKEPVYVYIDTNLYPPGISIK